MNHDAYLALTGQYVELGGLLEHLRELQDQRMLAADSAGRADLQAACLLIERTKERMLVMIEDRKFVGQGHF
jgi:hypothetical protein